MYATADDVIAYTGKTLEDLPEDINRIIQRASEQIDYFTLNRAGTWYKENEGLDNPVTKATAAQVGWLLDTGGEIDPAIKFYQIGHLRIDYRDHDGDPTVVGGLFREAYQTLLLAGLLYRGVQ